jgi:hypothetical protein
MTFTGAPSKKLIPNPIKTPMPTKTLGALLALTSDTNAIARRPNSRYWLLLAKKELNKQGQQESYSAAAIVLKTAVRLVPTNFTAVIMTIAIKEAINAYSIAVTADSCLTNLLMIPRRIGERTMIFPFKN